MSINTLPRTQLDPLTDTDARARWHTIEADLSEPHVPSVSNSEVTPRAEVVSQDGAHAERRRRVRVHIAAEVCARIPVAGRRGRRVVAAQAEVDSLRAKRALLLAPVEEFQNAAENKNPWAAEPRRITRARRRASDVLVKVHQAEDRLAAAKERASNVKMRELVDRDVDRAQRKYDKTQRRLAVAEALSDWALIMSLRHQGNGTLAHIAKEYSMNMAAHESVAGGKADAALAVLEVKLNQALPGHPIDRRYKIGPVVIYRRDKTEHKRAELEQRLRDEAWERERKANALRAKVADRLEKRSPKKLLRRAAVVGLAVLALL